MSKTIEAEYCDVDPAGWKKRGSKRCRGSRAVPCENVAAATEAELGRFAS